MFNFFCKILQHPKINPGTAPGHEGLFVIEIDKYIVSFFFDDKGLKLTLLN